jgi:hypothetical protein
MNATRVTAVAVVQIAVLLTLVGIHWWDLTSGTPVALTARADLGRLVNGAQAKIGYDIGRLDLAELDGAKTFRRRDPVYVVLEQGSEQWQAVGVYHRQPPLIDGQVVMAGSVAGVERAKESKGEAAGADRAVLSAVRVRYGIEHYRIPARSVPSDTDKDAALTVRVTINRFGDATIAAVFLGGKLLYEEPAL